ncbi:GNAT family N-acetyltransferase [Streptosporangium sp. NPDC050855]|uniref:GNAT family N-acetyltransferase n=1 Tax=Streptosporangium sp. NPDC050855 TaxID=3366194 RepID=UPI0037904586
MTGTPPTTEIVIETHGPSEACALTGTVCELYRAVFSLPPFNGSAEEFANQRRYLPRLLHRPGFRLTTARSGPDFIGFGYGYLLPPDTAWWSHLADPVDEEFATETGTRTFAVIDYGVLPGSRNAGIGRRIHDELLGGSGAERATLTVQPAAVRTQAVYRRWGWRKVSRRTMDPPIPAPVFDVLVLERMPGPSGADPVR